MDSHITCHEHCHGIPNQLYRVAEHLRYVDYVAMEAYTLLHAAESLA